MGLLGSFSGLGWAYVYSWGSAADHWKLAGLHWPQLTCDVSAECGFSYFSRIFWASYIVTGQGSKRESRNMQGFLRPLLGSALYQIVLCLIGQKYHKARSD